MMEGSSSRMSESDRQLLAKLNGLNVDLDMSSTTIDESQHQFHGIPTSHNGIWSHRGRHTESLGSPFGGNKVNRNNMSQGLTSGAFGLQQPSFNNLPAQYTQVAPTHTYSDTLTSGRAHAPQNLRDLDGKGFVPALAPPVQWIQGPGQEDDSQSVCTSHCGPGAICHGTACSAGGSECDNESCLVGGQSIDGDVAMTSEDTKAAAALHAIQVGNPDVGDIHQQYPQPYPHSLSEQQLGEIIHDNWRMEGLTAESDQVLGLDTSSAIITEQLGISDELASKYQHMFQAHYDLEKPFCNDDYCSIDDPNFFQQCHLRHGSPQRQWMFDEMEADQHHEETMAGSECGLKLPDMPAMVKHFWTEHIPPVPMAPAPLSHEAGAMFRMPSSASVESSAFHAADTSFGHRVTPSSHGATPLTPPDEGETRQSFSGFSLEVGDYSTASRPSTSSGLSVKTDGSNQIAKCLWCSTSGDSACELVFANAHELQAHVKADHLASLSKEAIEQTFLCGWLGCDRRHTKGFPQRSKLERHIQAHTNCEPLSLSRFPDATNAVNQTNPSPATLATSPSRASRRFSSTNSSTRVTSPANAPTAPRPSARRVP